MRLSGKHILSGALLCCSAWSYGQDAAQNAGKWQRYTDSVTAGKMNKPFLTTGLCKGLNGTEIDFSRLQKSTFVCFGMNGCAPCRRELPVIVTLAAKHPELDFVYITHDDAGNRETEFTAALGKDYKLPSNYSILQLSVEDMKLRQIYLGYPAKYLLDKNGIVRYFRWGGESMKKTAQEVEQLYEAVLSSTR